MVTTEEARPARKTRRGEATRDRIISTAEALIARHGPDGFQLQHVTEALGITPPAIYNHFKDREDLVAHIAEKGGRMLADRMRRQTGEDILTSLRRNAREYVAFLMENPAHARIILWEIARRGTLGWRGLATSNIEVRDRMRAAFEVATARGEIRPVPVETYLQFLYIGYAAAAVWADYPEDAPGVEPAALPQHDPEEIRRLQDQAEDLVVQLLTPDAATRPH